MSNKTISTLVIAAIAGIISLICFVKTLHVNDTQKLQIIQSISGYVTVRREAGWYPMVCPRIWEYAKAGIYRLNAKDKDLLDIQFKNKTTAKLRANIGYRIDGATDEQLIALHQQVEGDDEKIWQMLLTALNTAAQSISTKYDPSDVIGGDQFEPLIREIYTAIMHNKELLIHGIDVNYFAVDGRPLPDEPTQKQFEKQKEADLARRLAIAEQQKLEAEKLKVEANYKMQIAEQQGRADAETAKLQTEAERTKKLAEIAAQQKVEVEKLEKEQMLVKASKELEVAEIAKQTEQKQLDIIKIKAEQKIAEAKAKKEAITLAGEIKEEDRLRLEFEMKTKIGIAAEMAKTYAHWNPQVIQVSGGNGNVSAATSALDNFLNTAAAKTALEMTSSKSQSTNK